MRLKHIAVVSFALMFCNQAAFCSQQAKLVKAEGNVDWHKSSQTAWAAVKSGAPLNPGDTLRTGKGAKAEILFENGSRIRMSQLSNLVIHPPKTEKKKQNNVKLNAGRIFVSVKKTLKPDFAVETPTTIVGVRGTLFSVGVEDSGETVVSVKEGVVEVQGLVEMVLVEADQQTFVQQGEEPAQPVEFSETEAQTWEEEGLPWGEEIQELEEETESEEESEEYTEELGEYTEEELYAYFEELIFELLSSPEGSVLLDEVHQEIGFPAEVLP